MSTLATPVAPARPRVPAPPATRPREDLVTVVTSLWLMLGLFVDGWAHVNLTELETFFTPWHGLFYSGFTVTGLWVLWLVHRRRVPGDRVRDAVPAGYGLGLVGLAVFAAGGVGDLLWHTAFGIEVELDALYSPTHVLLFAGMVLILTSPVRAAWRRREAGTGWGALGAAVGGATLAAAMLVFAFMYWSPVMDAWPATAYVEHGRGGELEKFFTLMGMASLFTQAVILVGSLALLLRRWVPPRGAAVVLFTVPTLLASALGEFQFVDLVPATLLAGVVTDVTVAMLRPSPARPWALRATTAVAAAALTASYLVAVAVTRGVGWAPEFTSGVVAWASALGLGLGTLVAPPADPDVEAGYAAGDVAVGTP